MCSFEADEIFESEFKMWKKESLNIQSNMDLDENQKIKLLPEKTLRLVSDLFVRMEFFRYQILT